MTYLSEALSESLKFPTHLTDAQEQTSLENYSEQIASLFAQLPSNDLAVFGHEPVRSHPYPQWPISDERDIHALVTVVRSGQWGGAPFPGPYTRTFAAEFAEMQAGSSGGSVAVPMANGSITLEVALRAAQIGWGDEVIVPAYTFQATAAAPIAAGAIPVIVDVDPDTYCLSPAAIEAAITPKTRAIIPVHLGAQVADMDAIMMIAKRHDLVVIEDCAHAHGAQWNGQGVGTFGHFGSFSLQSSKILTVGEGGVLLCRTQALAARATSIIDCGRLPTSEDLRELAANALGAKTHPNITQLVQQLMAFSRPESAFSLGTNYRMSEFQAAVGSVALTRFAQQVEERETMLAYLESRLDQVPGVRSLKHDPRHTKRSFYRYIFALVPEAFGASHDEVCWALRAEGIPCTTGYPALHQHSLFQPTRSRLPVPSAFPERFDYEALSLPEAEKACAQEAIWLDESVFRAGKAGVDDAIAALQKVQHNAPILSAAKAAFSQVFPS